MKNKLAIAFYSVTLLTPDVDANLSVSATHPNTRNSLSIASTLERKMTSQTRVTTATDADFLQKVMDREPTIIQWIC